MKHRMLVAVACTAGALWSIGTGCNQDARVSGDGLVGYDVALTAGTTSALPRCTSVLNGTVARVDSPPSLWACKSGRWNEIKCSGDDFGEVAYASASSSLYACVGKTWTPIALPGGSQGPAGPQGPTGLQGSIGAQGPTGPQGPQGAMGAMGAQGPAGTKGAPGATGEVGAPALAASTPEPAGPNCAGGGTLIELGTDTNANEMLDEDEVTSSFYVCNGISTTSGMSGTGGTGGSEASGGTNGGGGTGGSGSVGNETLIVSPGTLTLPVGGSGEFTVQLTLPAEAAGTQLSLSASPTGALFVPATVTVPGGSTLIAFSVVAVASGLSQVTITLDGTAMTVLVFVE